MADIYRANIARVELDGDLVRERVGSLLATGDKLANRFGVAVYRDGESVSIADKALVGYFIRPEADTVVINGTTSGNTGYVELPQSCYTQEGAFSLALKLAGGDVVQTVRLLDGRIALTQEGALVDPGSTVPTLDDILAQIDACEAATEAAVEAVDTLDSKTNQFGMLGGYYTVTVGAEHVLIDATGGIMRVLGGNTWNVVPARKWWLYKPEGLNHGVIYFESGMFFVEGVSAFLADKNEDQFPVGIVYWDANGKITRYEINGQVNDQRSSAYGGSVVRDVRLFGAMGDGVTDDTEAIQSALDACTNGILYFPNGTYLFSNTLYIHSNTHLMGNKGYTRIKLKPQQDNDLDELEWRPADGRNKFPAVMTEEDSTGVIVEGIIFEGDNVYFHDLQQNGLYITGSHHVIQDCQFINWNYFPDKWEGRKENAPAWGLAICHANHIKVEDCYFNQNGYEGAGTEFSYQVDFRGCYFGKAMRTALQIHRASARISLEGCVLNNSVDSDNPLGDFATMTFHGADGALIDGVKIVNCDFRHRHIQCVMGCERNVQISNCRLYSDSGYFVIITMGADGSIPQNEGWQIVGNEFFSIKGDGITTINANVDKSMVACNIIHSNANAPVVLTGANNLAVNNLIVPVGTTAEVSV